MITSVTIPVSKAPPPAPTGQTSQTGPREVQNQFFIDDSEESEKEESVVVVAPSQQQPPPSTKKFSEVDEMEESLLSMGM